MPEDSCPNCSRKHKRKFHRKLKKSLLKYYYDTFQCISMTYTLNQRFFTPCKTTQKVSRFKEPKYRSLVRFELKYDRHRNINFILSRQRKQLFISRQVFSNLFLKRFLYLRKKKEERNFPSITVTGTVKATSASKISMVPLP